MYGHICMKDVFRYIASAINVGFYILKLCDVISIIYFYFTLLGNKFYIVWWCIYICVWILFCYIISRAPSMYVAWLTIVDYAAASLVDPAAARLWCDRAFEMRFYILQCDFIHVFGLGKADFIVLKILRQHLRYTKRRAARVSGGCRLLMFECMLQVGECMGCRCVCDARCPGPPGVCNKDELQLQGCIYRKHCLDVCVDWTFKS